VTKESLTWLSILAFAISAALWLASTVVKADARKIAKAHEEETGWAPAQIVGDDGSDFYATVQMQAKWSRCAALATAIALALQAIATTM
jgi:hypothetical protein